MSSSNFITSILLASQRHVTVRSSTQSASNQSAAASLPNPDDVAVSKNMQTLVLQLNDFGTEDDDKNTDKAYNNKIREFFQFCELVYGDQPNWYVLDFEKVYRFMFYTSFREQPPKGRELILQGENILTLSITEPKFSPTFEAP